MKKNRLTIHFFCLLALAALVSSSYAGTIREDPLTNLTYHVEIPGHLDAFFAEISGIGSENEVIESMIVDGQGQSVIVKNPGRLKFTDITLKRGITTNMELWTWRKLVEDGDVATARSNGTITLFNQSLEAVVIWNIESAWPSKVISSGNNSQMLEELTIAVESYERVQ